MLSLLNNADFFSQYGLLIVLVVALVVLMLISFNNRKKEDAYRSELNSKVVPGSLIKTYYGLYGKVLKITETTDGKILLIETGEDKKVSYLNIHINAVYAIDEKKEIVLDENGNEVQDSKSEAEKKFEELEKKLAEKEAQENKQAEKPATKARKTTTKTDVKPAEKKTTTKTKTTAKTENK